MDTYPKYLRERNKEEEKEWAVVLYADDVKLQTKQGNSLQNLLDSSTNWANEFEMVWATHKCNIIAPTQVVKKWQLAGGDPQQVEEITYLGVSICSNQITTARSMKQIETAKNMTKWLQRCKLDYKSLKPKAVRNICNAFIY